MVDPTPGVARALAAAFVAAALLAAPSATALDLGRVRQLRQPAERARAAADGDAQLQALVDFAGDDLRGRDGRLARIGHDLLLLHHEHRVHRARAGAAPFRASMPGLQVSDERVLVDVVADAEDDTAVAAAIDALGRGGGRMRGRVHSGWVPIAVLPRLGSVRGVRFVRPVHVVRHAGLATSQADVVHGAQAARGLHGVDGSGIVVGVLSDSFDCLGGAGADQASGDLPGSVVVLEEVADCTGAVDEGRAMAQLVHDLTPGAGIAFHSAFNGTAAFASGIADLVHVAGAGVVVDDVGVLNEPWFQDGIVARAVDEVVSTGVAYFSSAGNFARQSYESAHRASGIGGALGERHDFDAGAGTDTLQALTIPAGATVRWYLQWDQAFFSASGPPGAASDLALVVYTDTSPPLPLFASSDANVAGDAFDYLGLVNTGAAGVTIQLAIERLEGPAPARVKYLYIGPLVIGEHVADTRAATILGHANAAGARAVGAAWYRLTPAFGITPAQVEPYSSRAGVVIRLDAAGSPVLQPRPKPELVAADGADTTFFGSADVDGSGFPDFFGTSAAAPHAAAIGALVLDADPSLPPAAVYRLLADTAADMAAPGFDDDSGVGLVDAAAAVAAAAEGPGSGAAPGSSFAGSYLAVPASPTLASVQFHFATEQAHVTFAFATPSGSVRVSALGAAGQVLSTAVVAGAVPFAHAGATWLSGQAATAAAGTRGVRIEVLSPGEGLLVDSLRFAAGAGNGVTGEADVPLPAAAWVALFLAFALTGVSRRR
jgi:hypothetical protein